MGGMRAAGAVVVLAVSILGTGAARAAIIQVCPSGCAWSSIQSGIDAAVDGDIVLVGDGTYRENVDFRGKEITVQSENGAASRRALS